VPVADKPTEEQRDKRRSELSFTESRPKGPTTSLTENKSQNNTTENRDNVSVEQAASVACVLEDEDTEEDVAVKDAETLPLHNAIRKKQSSIQS